MRNFIFENSTKAYFGKGCVGEHLSKELGKYGSNVMLGYGGGSVKRNGVYDEVMSVLAASGKKVTEFAGIMANPTYSKVLEGKKLALDNDIDLIIAVGGGSVMDCCKAVSMAAAYDGDVWDDFWAKEGTVDFDPLPLGVIVTASGTGSEMNGGAVITEEQSMIKTDRDYPSCNPKFAFLDPVYTYSVPRMQVAAGGFDILSHIMEIYFSGPDDNNVSDEISEALMRNTIRSLRGAMKDPEDYASRSDLMWDATMAENRIIKLGKDKDFEAHNIEHQLSAFTDCSHGCGLAVIQPVYYRHIYRDGLWKFRRFATEVWGIDGEGKNDEQTALEGVEALAGFAREIGLPATLRELGVQDRSMLAIIAESCNISMGAYRPMTHEEILEILEECY